MRPQLNSGTLGSRQNSRGYKMFVTARFRKATGHLVPTTAHSTPTGTLARQCRLAASGSRSFPPVALFDRTRAGSSRSLLPPVALRDQSVWEPGLHPSGPTLFRSDARCLFPKFAAIRLASLPRPATTRFAGSLATSSFHPRAQHAVATVGRTLSPPETSHSSPVVDYHGLARRYLMPLGF
jgi:hypothetical protein